MHQRMNECPSCRSTDLENLIGDWQRCRQCRLGFRPVRYAPDNVAQSEEDREAVWRDSQTRNNLNAIDRVTAMLGKPGKLLDIGCGHGYFMKLAITRGWNVEGIEISEPSLRQARDKYCLTVHDRPLGMLGLAPSSFDAVTLMGVIDLVPDPLKELKDVAAVLKPGGVVCLRVNNFDFHYPAFRLGQTSLFRALKVQPGVVHRYGINSRALRALLENAGFTDIEIVNFRPTEGDPYGTGGTMGAIFVSVVKKLLFIFWQAAAIVSGGRLIWSSSMLACARKRGKTA